MNDELREYIMWNFGGGVYEELKDFCEENNATPIHALGLLAQQILLRSGNTEGSLTDRNDALARLQALEKEQRKTLKLLGDLVNTCKIQDRKITSLEESYGAIEAGLICQVKSGERRVEEIAELQSQIQELTRRLNEEGARVLKTEELLFGVKLSSDEEDGF